ncbi:MAG TPA: Maf family protein [Burkholderiales bacterium]|nr:Maf family protein [Burkholderiales bacterium]
MAEKSIYLASRSPRRRDLLKQIGIDFEMLLLRSDPRRGPDVDETPRGDETPLDYAVRIARMKAEVGMRAVAMRRLRPKPVLAADTTVVLGDAIIGKPADRDDAVQILSSLSGREHQVISVVAMSYRDQVEHRVSTSAVWFRKIADEEIRRYADSGEPMDKAGAYGIQGRAGVFVTRIEGSYSGIMGLPLAETAELMHKFGIAVL